MPKRQLLLLGALALTSGFRPAQSQPSPAANRDIEVDAGLEPLVDGSIRARASVEIAASKNAVRDAIFDLQARADEGWIVDSVSLYQDDTSGARIHRRARWELSILGFEIVYHCVYDWTSQSNQIVWSLDESQPNDLRQAQGVYTLEDGSERGTTVLTYTVEVGSEHAAARPLKRSLTKRNVRRLLESVRTRAEAQEAS